MFLPCECSPRERINYFEAEETAQADKKRNVSGTDDRGLTKTKNFSHLPRPSSSVASVKSVVNLMPPGLTMPHSV